MILPRSLDNNYLTGSIFSPDMSAVLKLAEVLPQIQTLRCLLQNAAAPC